jgi:hypothetical protein
MTFMCNGRRTVTPPRGAPPALGWRNGIASCYATGANQEERE